MMAGALPDFWFALIAIFVFFYSFDLLPGPIGRIDLMVSTPDTITGMYTFDSLITANWEALASSSAQLFLPVLTLVFVFMPLVMKNARSAMEDMLNSEFVTFARAAGRPQPRLVYLSDAALTAPNLPGWIDTLQAQGRPVIFFTLGLIADARNSDELAFVLGHEAAHHIAGHLAASNPTRAQHAHRLGGQFNYLRAFCREHDIVFQCLLPLLLSHLDVHVGLNFMEF